MGAVQVVTDDAQLTLDHVRVEALMGVRCSAEDIRSPTRSPTASARPTGNRLRARGERCRRGSRRTRTMGAAVRRVLRDQRLVVLSGSLPAQFRAALAPLTPALDATENPPQRRQHQ